VPDGVIFTFATDINDSYELPAVGACMWETTVPAVVAEKLIYGSGDTVCSGGSPIRSTGGGVVMRVVRTGDGWDAHVGQYAAALDWGDVAAASINSAACNIGDVAPSNNEICHLAEVDNPLDYDTHATGGMLSVDVAGQPQVCP
jgi:hypothetical protein